MTKEAPRYRDRCDECCPAAVYADPLRIERTDNADSEHASYRCPAGHTWQTYWNYGDTNYRAA